MSVYLNNQTEKEQGSGEYLPSMCKAVGSTPAKKKQNKNSISSTWGDKKIKNSKAARATKDLHEFVFAFFWDMVSPCSPGCLGASNSPRSSCLCFLGAGNKDPALVFAFFFLRKISFCLHRKAGNQILLFIIYANHMPHPIRSLPIKSLQLAAFFHSTTKPLVLPALYFKVHPAVRIPAGLP